MGVNRLLGFISQFDRSRDEEKSFERDAINALVPEDYNDQEIEENDFENMAKVYWFEENPKKFPPVPYACASQDEEYLQRVSDPEIYDGIDSLIIDGNNLKFTLCDFNCDKMKPFTSEEDRVSETMWTSHFSSWSHFELQELSLAFARVLQKLNIKVYFVEDSIGFIDGRKTSGRDNSSCRMWESVGRLRKILNNDRYPHQKAKDFVDNVHGIQIIFKHALCSTFGESENLVCLKGTLEADATLARIAYIERLRGRNAYILSKDSDLTLYPHVKGLITTIIDFSEAHPAIKGSPPAIRFKCIYPEILSRKLFRIQTLEHDQNHPIQPNHILPAIWAALNGNDYIWETILAPFHDKLREDQFNYEVEQIEQRTQNITETRSDPMYWAHLNWKNTTISIKNFQDWKRILRFLFRSDFSNYVYDMTVGGWIIHSKEDQTGMKDKVFHVSREDIQNLPLDEAEANILQEGYFRFGILDIVIFKFYETEGEEERNNFRYEIQLSVENLKYGTLIEEILHEHSFVDSVEPFAHIQVLTFKEKNSLFSHLARKIKTRFDVVGSAGQVAGYDLLNDCIDQIYNFYTRNENENLTEWHHMYKRHVENWLGIRKLQVTRDLIEKKLVTTDQETLTSLLDQVNEIYGSVDEASPADIFTVYRMPFTDASIVDKHERFREDVNNWLFEKVDYLVTQARVKERMYKAIDVYNLMFDFDWQVRIQNKDNTTYNIPKTGVIDISTLLDKVKSKSGIIDTFDLVKPIKDAKWTIQYFNIDIIHVTGDQPYLQKRILTNTNIKQYTFRQTQMQTLVHRRVDPFFDYKVTRIVDPLNDNELIQERIPFLVENDLVETMSLNSAQSTRSYEAWEMRFISSLKYLQEEESESYIDIKEYIDNHSNDVMEYQEPMKLLYLTLRYWINRTREACEDIDVENEETLYPWCLQKKWLQAILAVIFKRLFQQKSIVLRENEFILPDYDTAKFMTSWMDLVSNMSSLVTTIDDYRKLINNQHRSKQIPEELRGNLYGNFTNANLFRSERRVEHSNQNLQSVDFRPLFSSIGGVSSTLNVFAVDWKSMTNALKLLEGQEDDMETFFVSCGLNSSAKEMANTFFEALCNGNNQAVAF